MTEKGCGLVHLCVDHFASNSILNVLAKIEFFLPVLEELGMYLIVVIKNFFVV